MPKAPQDKGKGKGKRVPMSTPRMSTPVEEAESLKARIEELELRVERLETDKCIGIYGDLIQAINGEEYVDDLGIPDTIESAAIKNDIFLLAHALIGAVDSNPGTYEKSYNMFAPFVRGGSVSSLGFTIERFIMSFCPRVSFVNEAMDREFDLEKPLDGLLELGKKLTRLLERLPGFTDLWLVLKAAEELLVFIDSLVLDLPLGVKKKAGRRMIVS